MKKAVITAFDITTARRAGQTSLAVPEGALVTPQAADDARDHGITLMRGGQAPVASSAPVAAAAAPASLDVVSDSGMASGVSSLVGLSFIRKAGGVTLVAAAAMPAVGNIRVAPTAVTMAEAAPPTSAAPGVAYMRWENSSFSWTFRHAEVLVVLEGEITVATASAALAGKPGDAFLIPAGSVATLSASGRARCVHSSWPNPETAKG
jgi:uncharacterized cupin superfamily protein